jgi:hypothetical protein
MSAQADAMISLPVNPLIDPRGSIETFKRRARYEVIVSDDRPNRPDRLVLRVS